jgi:hypothetical protein
MAFPTFNESSPRERAAGDDRSKNIKLIMDRIPDSVNVVKFIIIIITNFLGKYGAKKLDPLKRPKCGKFQVPPKVREGVRQMVEAENFFDNSLYN